MVVSELREVQRGGRGEGAFFCGCPDATVPPPRPRAAAAECRRHPVRIRCKGAASPQPLAAGIISFVNNSLCGFRKPAAARIRAIPARLFAIANESHLW